MAKDKTKDKAKGPKSVPNKHLHARISFLQQAATYLALQELSMPDESASTAFSTARNRPKTQHIGQDSASIEDVDMNREPGDDDNTGISDLVHEATSSQTLDAAGLSFHLSSHLRQVARKSQIRLHPSIKRSSCKVCNAVLVEGQNCSKYVENLSKGGKKQHADVLVLECRTCGSKKRFPVNTQRQQKKALRSGPSHQSQEKEAVEEAEKSPLLP